MAVGNKYFQTQNSISYIKIRPTAIFIYNFMLLKNSVSKDI
jgi:hypothetical protein